MKPIKVSEATGAVLDWMVAKCEGAGFHYVGEKLCVLWSEKFDVQLSDYSPSTDWAQGGPIIDREGITSGPWTTSPAIAYKGTDHGRRPFCHVGPTPLIAAMRCLVASKLGDTVNVPEELLV